MISTDSPFLKGDYRDSIDRLVFKQVFDFAPFIMKRDR